MDFFPSTHQPESSLPPLSLPCQALPSAKVYSSSLSNSLAGAHPSLPHSATPKPLSSDVLLLQSPVSHPQASSHGVSLQVGPQITIDQPPPVSPTPTIETCTHIVSLPLSWVSVLSNNQTSGRTKPHNSKNRLKPSNVIVSSGIASSSCPAEVYTNKKPLWDNIIVGHFIGDTAPHIGTVHAKVNRLWPTASLPCKIDAQFVSSKYVLFKIPNSQLRNQALDQHFWHIAEIPLVVQKWNPQTENEAPDMSSIPLWVDLKGVPNVLFQDVGLFYLGDIIGVTQKLHHHTARCTKLDKAILLIDMNLNKVLPTQIRLEEWHGLEIMVSYPWLPAHCSICSTSGHLVADCSLQKLPTQKVASHKEVQNAPRAAQAVWVKKTVESQGEARITPGTALIVQVSKVTQTTQSPSQDVPSLVQAGQVYHVDKVTPIFQMDGVQNNGDIESWESLVVDALDDSGDQSAQLQTKVVQAELPCSTPPVRSHLPHKYSQIVSTSKVVLSGHEKFIGSSLERDRSSKIYPGKQQAILLPEPEKPTLQITTDGELVSDVDASSFDAHGSEDEDFQLAFQQRLQSTRKKFPNKRYDNMDFCSQTNRKSKRSSSRKA